MKLYKLLLVDDEKDFCETFRDRVSSTGDTLGLSVRVDDVQNWDDAALNLRHGDYHAVVLDARCLVSSDQEVDDFGFLPVALSGIEEIEREKDRRIPVAVNTGYIGERELDTVDRLLRMRSIRKFSKTGDGSELVKYILAEIDAAPERWIELKYADVFEVFNTGLLNAEYRDSLRNILLTNFDTSKIKENLGALRIIQEEIYKALEARGIYDPRTIPKRSDRPSFKEKNMFLAGLRWDDSKKRNVVSGTVFQTDTITKMAESIYTTASNYGNHRPEDRPNNVEVKYWERPSVYIVKGLTYGLLEQILWLRELTK